VRGFLWTKAGDPAVVVVVVLGLSAERVEG